MSFLFFTSSSVFLSVLKSEVCKYISSAQHGSTLCNLMSVIEEALKSNIGEDGGVPAWIDSLVDAMIGNLNQVSKQAASDRNVRVSDYLDNLLRVIEEQGTRPADLTPTISELDGKIVEKECIISMKKRQAFYYDITNTPGDEREFKRIKKELNEEEQGLSSMKSMLGELKVSLF